MNTKELSDKEAQEFKTLLDSINKMSSKIHAVSDTKGGFTVSIKAEERCTCREDSKQRAVCPVCDSEKYQIVKEAFLEAYKKV